MSENSTKPNVEKIIESLQQGLNDTTPFNEAQHKMDAQQKLKSTLRKAAESAEILGRCDGSIRGKLCKKLAYIALPVVEQLDMHHAAILNAINLLHEAQSDMFEERISKLEAEIETLKSRSNS